VEKAQTEYRPKTTHREPEHERNPPHRTVSNPENISPKLRKDPKIALFKTRLYPSIPVKPHFSIDSKPLTKIKLYSPQIRSKFISVSQYAPQPPIPSLPASPQGKKAPAIGGGPSTFLALIPALLQIPA
jgi:hypothetical protein